MDLDSLIPLFLAGFLVAWSIQSHLHMFSWIIFYNIFVLWFPWSFIPWCCAKSLQSCLTLCDPMDHSPADSSAHGILQARILEWVVISFSRKSSLPRDRTFISCVAGGFFLPLSHGGSISLKRRQLDSDLLLHLIGCTITLMSKLHSYSWENESEKGK